MKNYKVFPKVTLLVLILLGIIAAIMFYVGGSAGTHEVAGDFLDIPKYSDLFLIWNYILLGIVILATVGVVVGEFIKNFKYEPKKAVSTLAVVVVFVALCALCWFLGSPEKIEILGYEGTDNQGFWAQLSDATIYLCYILLGGTLVSALFGFIYTKTVK